MYFWGGVLWKVSPKYYSITTGLYNQSTEEDQKNVATAMGLDNTEERFKLYFQYYNANGDTFRVHQKFMSKMHPEGVPKCIILSSL